jgi:hypothetical protein
MSASDYWRANMESKRRPGAASSTVVQQTVHLFIGF